MTWLPIVDRELRTRARQGTTYWTRGGLGTVALLVALQTVTFQSGATTPGALGGAVFRVLSWLALALACACVLVTADAISGERREGTLGLLFLADLKGRDIVLGKLAAAGISAFYSMVGFAPALALMFLLGGVSGGVLFGTILALLNALFFALSLGLWVSARKQERQVVMRESALWMGGLFLIAIALSPASILAFVSPCLPFIVIIKSGATLQEAPFWISLIFSHAAGWLLLWRSAFWLRSNSQTPELINAMPAPESGQDESLNLIHNPEKGSALLESSPIRWLASRVPGKKPLLWTGTVLMVVGLAMGSAIGPLSARIWGSVNLVLALGSGAAFAWLAGRFFFEARRTGELELLLSTPLGARDIIEGYWWAIWKPLRTPLLAAIWIIFVQFLLAASAGTFMFGRPSGLKVMQIAFVPAGKALDVLALSWVGMWYGLRLRKPLFVIAWTCGLVIGLPWIFSYMLILIATGGGPISTVTRGARGLEAWFAYAPVLYIAKNIFFIAWAARNLRTELRTAAPIALGDWLK